MASLAWQNHCAALVRMIDRKNRAFRVFMNRTHALARAAHPATGGNECMCRNWGNAECNRIWSEGWARWDAYSRAFQRRYDAYIRAGRSIA